ncbi:MAG: hypothetical protein IPN92_08915 [Chromatiaceae bacterium]|nr:hypothetical protein [Chromatiaceae bacterium]
MPDYAPPPPQPEIRTRSQAESGIEQPTDAPARASQPDEGSGTVRPGAVWKTVAIAAAVAVGVALGALFLGGGAADQVTDQERSRIEAEFNALSSVQLPAVATADRDRALDSMKLPPAERTAIATAVDQGQVKLGWITLWDNYVEDGDRVLLSSDSLTIPVALLNAKTTVAMPLPNSGVVNLTGVNDGGGGITVGVLSGGNPVRVPVMAPGQTIGIPVVAAP